MEKVSCKQIMSNTTPLLFQNAIKSDKLENLEFRDCIFILRSEIFLEFLTHADFFM